MKTARLEEVKADRSSVFVDNILLQSALRALDGNYDDLLRSPFVQGENPEVSLLVATRFLLAHDLANLSSLCESLLLSEELYVNAENMQTDSGTGLHELTDCVVGITLAPQAAIEAQNMVVRHPVWGRKPSHDIDTVMQEMVSHACHDFSWHDRYGPPQRDRSREATGPPVPDLIADLTAFPDAVRPFGRAYRLAISSGFYIACSQALGIPYRPSAIRAELLAPIMKEELAAWRQQAGSIALEYLQESRREVAEKYFSQLASLGILQVHMPLVLAGLLKEAESVSDLVQRVLALRQSAEGILLRQWAREMTDAMQTGSLAEVVPIYKELEVATSRANALLGIFNAGPTASLAYGPTETSLPFTINSGLLPPKPIERHVWVLQEIYRQGLNVIHTAPHIERILFPQYPTWFRKSIKDGRLHFGDDYFSPRRHR